MRESVKNQIMVEVAENGSVTKKAMRLYIENRISYQTFMKQVGKGIKIYESKQWNATDNS